MLRNSSKLKSFYHFTSINPHITLHTACKVIIERGDLEICHSFEEWNEIGRRINRGAKGIPYYDTNGYKRYFRGRINLIWRYILAKQECEKVEK